MKSSNKTGPQAVSTWSIKELGSLYIEHRFELFSHALRILKDRVRSEEVVQEALLKVILAGPELNSREHAVAYLHRVIENLCIDIFRHEGSRPNLILVSEMEGEIEASWHQKDDLADEMEKAEDAAIVRQALAMLSPAERAALVMWEIEGRSSEEIAAELGVNSRTVRHTVSRARQSLRRVLSEWIVDEERGFTALDLLSSTYRKTSNATKRAGKVTISVLVAFITFLGFDSFSSVGFISDPIGQDSPINGYEAPWDSFEGPYSSNFETMKNHSETAGGEENATNNERESWSSLDFPGLDNSGLPIGFTAADTSGGFGPAYFRARSALSTELDVTDGQFLKTQTGAANILISQSLDLDERGVKYYPMVSFGRAGSWVPLQVEVSSTELALLPNGNSLLTIHIAVESEVESVVKIPATTSGRDLTEAPRQIITRLVLDSKNLQVLSQAVYVVERGASL